MNPGTVLKIAPWEKSRMVLILGVLLLGACRGGGGAPGLSPADEAGIRRVDTLFAAAVNAGDIAGVAGTYGPDAWLFPPEAPPVQGRDGIRAFWAGFMRSYDVHLTVSADRVEGRGDLAYVAGHYYMETRPKSPEVPVLGPEDGKFLEVLKRGSDGSWAYAMDMYSANAPPK